jgi:hypothetical protein
VMHRLSLLLSRALLRHLAPAHPLIRITSRARLVKHVLARPVLHASAREAQGSLTHLVEHAPARGVEDTLARLQPTS